MMIRTLALAVIWKALYCLDLQMFIPELSA
jgi:hypothetical protein